MITLEELNRRRESIGWPPLKGHYTRKLALVPSAGLQEAPCEETPRALTRWDTMPHDYVEENYQWIYGKPRTRADLEADPEYHKALEQASPPPGELPDWLKGF